jgi:hypothetical protein
MIFSQNSDKKLKKAVENEQINTICNSRYFLKIEFFSFSVQTLYTTGSGNSLLQKPDKMYMQNPNLYYSFSNKNVNIGSLRETFFVNQLSKTEKINYSERGDFLVNENNIFEVGGRNKDYSQIANLPNSFIAADDIETGIGNKIPLWLFGFLY